MPQNQSVSYSYSPNPTLELMYKAAVQQLLSYPPHSWRVAKACGWASSKLHRIAVFLERRKAGHEQVAGVLNLVLSEAAAGRLIHPKLWGQTWNKVGITERDFARPDFPRPSYEN